MAKRLEDGRIELSNGHILDQEALFNLYMAAFLGPEDGPALDYAAEVMRDCPGPMGQTGPMGFSGPVGQTGPMAPSPNPGYIF